MVEKYSHTTIRATLLEMVADHMKEGEIHCPHAHELGCELIPLLAAYREEDRRLFPEVYLFTPTDVDLLPVLAPGVRPIRIGETNLKAEAEHSARLIARQVLKTCAGLAIDGWAVYIQRTDDGFSYGLFRAASASFSLSAESTLANSSLPVVILRHSAESTVEIVNSAGGRREISLSTATPFPRGLAGQIEDFARKACQDLNESDADRAVQYLTRLLAEFLRASHGTLLAVAPAEAALDPQCFPDGVMLAEPIPLVKLMLEAAGDEYNLEATSMLRSHESLLRGMIQSDGVTVLGTDGSIKAFRVFVRATTESQAAAANRATGGARSRAFEVLRSLLGTKMLAVMMRSQDGRTEVQVQS